MLFESLSILCVYNYSRISFYTLILAFRFLHRSHFVLPIIEDFRDFAAVKSFLYITIRNQCLNYIRDHRKEVDLAGRFSEETDADFDLMVIEEEAIEALYSAIDRLPAQSARIMRLVVKGDKNQEIADQLGISVNSVKTLKYNALNILRKELTGSLLLLLAWFEVQG